MLRSLRSLGMTALASMHLNKSGEGGIEFGALLDEKAVAALLERHQHRAAYRLMLCLPERIRANAVMQAVHDECGHAYGCKIAKQCAVSQCCKCSSCGPASSNEPETKEPICQRRRDKPIEEHVAEGAQKRGTVGMTLLYER